MDICVLSNILFITSNVLKNIYIPNYMFILQSVAFMFKLIIWRVCYWHYLNKL